MNTKQIAHQIRLKCVEIASRPTGCHLGGSLSCCDILAVLYGEILQKSPKTEIIFSKGHAAAAYYSVLWVTGRLEIDPSKHYGESDSFFTGHPNMKIPGVCFATGALGHGPSLGLGVAMARQLLGESTSVFVVVGDGELQEGSCWETFQVASAKNVRNYVVVVDANGGQNDGRIEDISPVGDLLAKFRAFGFEADQIDGHNHSALTEALSRPTSSRPKVVIAQTKKGFGIKALMDNPKCHYATVPIQRAEHWIKELKNAFST